MEHPKILLYQLPEQIIISKTPNMLRAVTTGAYYPTVAITRSIFAQNGEIRVWKLQKNNISLGGLDLSTLRPIFLEIP